MVSDHEIFERTTEFINTPVSVFSANQTIKGTHINNHFLSFIYFINLKLKQQFNLELRCIN